MKRWLGLRLGLGLRLRFIFVMYIPTKLCLPQPKADYLKKSFSYRGAKLWDSLSDDIRSKESFVAFKTSIRAPGQFLKII